MFLHETVFLNVPQLLNCLCKQLLYRVSEKFKIPYLHYIEYKSLPTYFHGGNEFVIKCLATHDISLQRNVLTLS